VEINLINGDCLEVMKTIPDKSVDMCLTDPPYGTTTCKWDTIIPYEPMWEQLHRIVKDNGAICLFGSEPFSSALRMSNIKRFKYDWYWNKNLPTGHTLAKCKPMNCVETISAFSNGKTYHLHRTRNPMVYYPQGVERNPRPKIKKASSNWSSVIHNETPGKFRGEYLAYEFKNYPRNLIKENSVTKNIHPSQKPVPLLEYLIKTYTLEGETVLDFTMGSGSTGVAAKNLNRKFIGIEKDEKYFEIAKQRINL
jgi:site-specific DNA-methyltransferase (adenine-specific)